MIKFFRHIRQQMVVENRFSKYMLYAIGEIILVVIGILIALQINNWNDNQKENKYILQLLENLSVEFKEDQNYLQNVYEIEQELFLPSAERLFQVHGNTNYVSIPDSLLGPSFRFATFTPAIKYSDNVFGELMGANLLSGPRYASLKTKLFEYYAQLDFLEGYSEKNIYFETYLMNELAQYYTMHLIDEDESREISKFSGAAESAFTVEYNLEAFRQNKQLNAQLYDMLDIHKDRVGGLEIILQLSEEIQSEINTLLDKQAQ